MGRDGFGPVVFFVVDLLTCVMEKAEIVPPINYEQSITKNRLVYNRNLDLLDISIYVITCGFTIAAIIGFTCYGYQNSDYGVLGITFVCVGWLIVGFITRRFFVIVEGKTAITNKNDVVTTINHFYEYMVFNFDDEHLIRAIKINGAGYGRIITVLFYQDKVYFHKATLARNSKSALSGLTDYLKCKEMAEYFVELQAKAEA